MTEKSIVEKAGEAVGYGMAMASDVADTIKTAFDAGSNQMPWEMR